METLIKKFITLLLTVGIVTAWAQDLVPFKDESGKYGYKDGQGKIISTPKYDAALPLQGKSIIARVMQNGKWGFVDQTAREVTALKYDRTTEFVLDAGDLFGVIQNGKWGFIDQKGKEVTPFKYDSHLNFFKEGMLAVKQNKKWGFINQTGEEAIPVIYDEVYSFEKGKARVKLNGRSLYIDKTGNDLQIKGL